MSTIDSGGLRVPKATGMCTAWTAYRCSRAPIGALRTQPAPSPPVDHRASTSNVNPPGLIPFMNPRPGSPSFVLGERGIGGLSRARK